MSLIGGEGWDMYNGSSAEIGYQSKWTLFQNQGTSLPAGRFGGQALRIVDGTGGGVITRIGHDLGASYSSGCIGFAMRRTANPSSNCMLIGTASGSLYQLYISNNASGVSVQRGDGVTIIPVGAFVSVVNQWFYVELAFTIANSGGYAELFINGVSQGSFTGDTQQQATADFRYIELRSPDETGAGNGNDFDDMYWKNDTTPLGELRVATLRAVADTADADFVPVGSSPNYNCVKETLVDGDTTYVQGSNSGDLDLYEYEDAPGDPSAIFGVQLVTFAKKTDAGARTLKSTIKSGTTLDTGTAVSLINTYDRYDRMVALDPNGSIPWTKTSVDAALAGPQIP